MDAGENAFCVGVDVGDVCMMWEGCGYGDSKDFSCVVIGSGRGGEVNFDGEYLSIVP